MSKTGNTWFIIAAAAVEAGLFIASLRMPVWHMKMESPQYQGSEALRVRVYPGSMAGDLREIQVLNHYIGVHIPQHLPQLRWLPIALGGAAGLGLIAAVLPAAARRRSLFGVALLLSLVMAASAGLAQWQMHQIGHQRDPHTVLKGIKDFTPPLLGRVKVANFEISAGLDMGALLIGAGLALQVGAGLLSRRSEVQKRARPVPPTPVRLVEHSLGA